MNGDTLLAPEGLTLTEDHGPTDRLVSLYGPGDTPEWEVWIRRDGKVYRCKAGKRAHRVRFGILRPFMRTVRDVLVQP